MIYDSFRDNPKINDILNSEQFPYSEAILGFRIKNELDIEQICNFLEITPEEYLDYEYCNLNIPTEMYISILEKLNQILDWVSGFFFFIPFTHSLMPQSARLRLCSKDRKIIHKEKFYGQISKNL